MSREIDNTTIEVILGGSLGERYGRSHELVARTPIEAFKLICMNYPEFKQEFVEASLAGAEYQFVVDDRRGVGEHELTLPVGGRKLVIAPVLAGAGGKAFSAIEAVVGIIIIAVAWWNPAGWTIGPSLLAAAIGTGVSLTLGGITGLLTTIPKANNASGAGDSLTSFYFNGPANTQQQGVPVTVVYGRMLVGSTAISASLQAIDLSQAPVEVGNLS